MASTVNEPPEDAPNRPTLSELGFKATSWDGWIHTLGENDEAIAKLRKAYDDSNSGISDPQ